MEKVDAWEVDAWEVDAWEVDARVDAWVGGGASKQPVDGGGANTSAPIVCTGAVSVLAQRTKVTVG